MKKRERKKVSVGTIMLGALALLIIPLLGEIFVEGWNWGISGFVFAWVMFTATGLLYKFLTRNVDNVWYRVALGLLVLAILVIIWGSLVHFTS